MSECEEVRVEINSKWYKARIVNGVRILEEAAMADSAGNVAFHENGIKYIWHVPSRTVKNTQGMVVAKDCYNLTQARKAVKTRR